MVKKSRSIDLVLASASPRRRQLLKRLGIRFRVHPSHVSETSTEKSPIRLVRKLALRKAAQVAKKLALTRPKGKALPSPDFRRERVAGGRMRRNPSVYVLGADTVVVLRGRILGKPRDGRDACRMLGHLSGSTHQVYTGVALVDSGTGRSIVGHAMSEVRMNKIPEKELAKLSRKHLDKAGSYAIQAKRDPIARVVKGSYDNVVGLPVAFVKTLLNRFISARHF